ncbi:hypothetical protein [Azotosporobacter soli]|uniref:hypothetical protein n=1 Tax=Azotosporobacter soli TaxID=3055040 RepID=UPI0031FE7ED7
MEDKLTAKQGLIIGSIVTPIGLHLKYPWNLGMIMLIVVGIVIWIIYKRKKYNTYNRIGLSVIAGAGMGSGLLMAGQMIEGIPMLRQLLASIGMMLVGLLLYGFGNHIKNPEEVTKAKLVYSSAIFIPWGILCLLMW